MNKTAQLLAEKDLTMIVLMKINGYSKPVKTKHLAKKLGIDRPDLVVILNKLKKQNKISWHIPKRTDDNQYFGWIKNKN